MWGGRLFNKFRRPPSRPTELPSGPPLLSSPLLRDASKPRERDSNMTVMVRQSREESLYHYQVISKGYDVVHVKIGCLRRLTVTPQRPE